MAKHSHNPIPNMTDAERIDAAEAELADADAGFPARDVSLANSGSSRTIEDLMAPNLLVLGRKVPTETIAAISQKLEDDEKPKTVAVLVKAHVPAGETVRVVTSGGRRFVVGPDFATLENQSLEHA